MSENIHGETVIKYKTCSSCKETKTEDLFIKNRLRCRKCKSVYDKIYNTENKKRIDERNKSFRETQKQKELKRLYDIQYRKINLKKLNAKRLIKLKTNIGCKIAQNMRSRLRNALKYKNIKKTGKTLDYLGCTIEECKKYLESKFKDGMTWDNYGLYGWHIDHILPCISFDLTDIENIKRCFNYTNLQPLWWYENLSKGGRTASPIKHGQKSVG